MTPTEVERDARVRFPYAGYSPEFVERYRALRETLDDEQLASLRRMIELAEQATVDEEHQAKWALVDGIARHFPPFAPAIRAVAHHVFELAKTSECGVTLTEDDPLPWIAACVGPVPGAEADTAA